MTKFVWMEVVPVGPTNVAVPFFTRSIDPQATSFGLIPDVCVRREWIQLQRQSAARGHSIEQLAKRAQVLWDM